MNDSFATPDSACPECGYKVDAGSMVGSGKREAPRPGDVSVCLNCAAANVFANDLTVRKATAGEKDSFGLDVAQVQLTIRSAPFYRTLINKRRNR